MVRDLKPSNVLVDEDGTLVVADFGIATITQTTLAQATATGGLKGTSCYMSPELWDPDGLGQATGKADVWAWGCVVVEMLSGNRPWKGKQDMQIMFKVISEKASPTLPDGLPQPFDALIRRCFAFDAATRPSARELAAALQLMVDEAEMERRGEEAEAYIAAMPAAAALLAIERRARTAAEAEVLEKDMTIAAGREEVRELTEKNQQHMRDIKRMKGFLKEAQDVIEKQQLKIKAAERRHRGHDHAVVVCTRCARDHAVVCDRCARDHAAVCSYRSCTYVAQLDAKVDSLAAELAAAKMRQAVRYCMARLRSPAFEAWKTAAWDSSRLAASASRVIQYRQNAALWSTFAGWCIHTYDVRRLMTAYSRVVLRAENAALWYAWAAWKQHTQNAAIDDMSTTMPPVAPDLAQEYASTFTHARMLRVCHILLLLTATHSLPLPVMGSNCNLKLQGGGDCCTRS